MDKTELAYLAGFFDGEGCISILSLSKQSGYISKRYQLRVQITNTKKSIMDWLGSLGWYIHERKDLKKHWKRCWVGYLRDHKASDFLKLVYPFLRVKKDEADVALEFQRHKDNTLSRGARGLSVIELEYREALKCKLSELKEQKI